jgi:outer membrane protein assembly factor BamD
LDRNCPDAGENLIFAILFMHKKTAIVISFGALLLSLSSCRKERIYESSTSDPKKENGLALGKFNKLVKSTDMEAKYAAAIRYFERDDFSHALTLFEELMTVYRGAARGEEVHYYYAYCNYNLEDYLVAGYQFRNYVKTYPNGKHTEECAYMNAYCFYLNSPEYSLDQIDTKLAIREFQRFTNNYPKSARIPECNEILDKLRAKLDRKSYENAMLYYNTGDYRASAVAFANHIREFPDSKHVEELNFLIIKSYYLLALNSIESKKQERFRAAVDSYIKFVDSYPNSQYLKSAETIYTGALKNLEKYNKQTS